MSVSAARQSQPSLQQADSVPLSLVRVRSKPARRFDVEPRDEAFRSTLEDRAGLALRRPEVLPGDLDARLEAGFGEAILATGAHVGLLHRRGEAFFYTVCVRGLDRGMHMMVWVSMWDAAIRHMLDRRSLFGAKHESDEHAVVARRLRGASDPGWVVAFPVLVCGSVEAVVELGRFGKPFDPSALDRASHAVHASI